MRTAKNVDMQTVRSVDISNLNFDLNLLRTLDVLLVERNVTRAAERLCVTQQATSSALQRLRAHFDDELLLRSGRKFELTPLAKSLELPVREALLSVRAALDTKPFYDPAASDYHCRIAMSDYCVHAIAPDLVRALLTQAPRVKMQVETISAHSFEKLEKGDLEFCLTSDHLELYETHAPRFSMGSHPVFDDDFVCVADPDHAPIWPELTLDAYLNARHNMPYFGRDIHTLVESAWADAGMCLDVAVKVPNFSSQLLTLPGTPLIATTQRRLAQALAPLLGLKIMECPLMIERLHEMLFWHQRNHQHPAHLFIRNLFIDISRAFGDTRKSND